MAELRRTIKCSNCGVDTNFYLSSELNLSELLVHGKCSRCGNSLQLNFSIVDQSGAKVEATPSSSNSASQAQSEESGTVNLDQSLFNSEPDNPSETIKDLIES